LSKKVALYKHIIKVGLGLNLSRWPFTLLFLLMTASITVAKESTDSSCQGIQNPLEFTIGLEIQSVDQQTRFDNLYSIPSDFIYEPYIYDIKEECFQLQRCLTTVPARRFYAKFLSKIKAAKKSSLKVKRKIVMDAILELGPYLGKNDVPMSDFKIIFNAIGNHKDLVNKNHLFELYNQITIFRFHKDLPPKNRFIVNPMHIEFRKMAEYLIHHPKADSSMAYEIALSLAKPYGKVPKGRLLSSAPMPQAEVILYSITEKLKREAGKKISEQNRFLYSSILSLKASGSPPATLHDHLKTMWDELSAANPSLSDQPKYSVSADDGWASHLRQRKARPETSKNFWGNSNAGSQTEDESVNTPSNYRESFKLVRDILTRPHITRFLQQTFKDRLHISMEYKENYDVPSEMGNTITETQLLLLFDQYPGFKELAIEYLEVFPTERSGNPTQKQQEKIDNIKAKIKVILEQTELDKNFQERIDPFADYILHGEYSTPEVYFNHPSLVNGVVVPVKKGHQPREKIIEFIDAAEKEIAVTVYDFDDMLIADALIRAKKRGINVRVGIDLDVVESRAEVKKLFDKLKKAGIDVHKVDATGLSHQKLVVRDWSLKGKGSTIFSSGNFTYSGFHPNGDLADSGKSHRLSVPNANHIVIIKSDVIANLVNHNITKTLDLKLRGAEYPLNGVYKIVKKDRTYLRITFAPGGALKNVNENLIGQEILDGTGKGPMKMVQFAYSSPDVDRALMERARREIAATGEFKFESVGDTPFSVQGWSGFLKMAGLERVIDQKTGVKYYREIPNSPWLKVLGAKRQQELRKKIRIAPEQYGEQHVDFEEGDNTVKIKLTGKIHHKGLVISDEAAIMGTSFNFSNGAMTNNEQVLVVHDPKITAQFGRGIDWLISQSAGTVFQETMRRNGYKLKQIEEYNARIKTITDYYRTSVGREQALEALAFLQKEIGKNETKLLLDQLYPTNSGNVKSIKTIHPVFNWDDNIFKDTNSYIRLYHKQTGKEMVMSTEDYAYYRTSVGKKGTKYEDYKIDRKLSFQHFDEDSKVGKDRFFEGIVKAVEKGSDSFSGPSYYSFVNSMSDKKLAEQAVLVFRGKRRPQDIMKGLEYLQKKGLIKNLPKLENIKVIPMETKRIFSKMDHSKRIIENDSKSLKDGLPVLSPDGKKRDKYHLFNYSTTNYLEFLEAQRVLQKDLDSGKIKYTKIQLRFTGQNHPSKTPREIVLVKGAAPRPVQTEELLEWGHATHQKK
jgi:phosphatidylserine/phosphatidylglycerophosphate/cardiolipin synthase-like enzyme